MPKALKKTLNDKFKNIGNRLKKLRTDKGLTLNQVAACLNPYVQIQLDGKSGETRISEIEKSNANLTPELAVAYSRVFDVSLEYVFCLSDDMRPENKEIKETLGLTDTTIAKIKAFSSENASAAYLKILNILFETDFMSELIHSLDSFAYTTQKYSNFVTLNFDDRQEDKEIVGLISRWKLEKSVSKAIDKIANLLEDSEELKLSVEEQQKSSP